MKPLHLLILSFLSTSAFAHNDDGYSHNANIMNYNQSNWMQDIPDTAKLSDLSIPGTHDSGSRYGGVAIENQVMTISQQLNAGIRYLDIRVRHIDDAFAIHHGLKYQHLNFDDVMKSVTQFLETHPSETILMRLHEEYKADNNTRSIEETMDSYIKKYQKYFYSTYSFYEQNPQMSALRGKIFVIWDNFSSTGSIPVTGTRFSWLNLQDAYSVKTNWDLYNKWQIIKKFINANKSSSELSLNHLSASGGSFPYFIASGHSSAGTSAPRLATGLTTPGWKNKYPDFPRVSCFIGICTIAFEGTNTLTKNYLNTNDIERTGIIAADFPGQGLIDSIIRKNSFEVMRYSNTQTNQCITQTSNAGSNLQSCRKELIPQQRISSINGQIRNQERCLTSANGGTMENSAVTFSVCQNGENQKWVNQNHQLVTTQKGKRWCLANPKNTSKLVLRSCASSDSGQYFSSITESHAGDKVSIQWSGISVPTNQDEDDDVIHSVTTSAKSIQQMGSR